MSYLAACMIDYLLDPSDTIYLSYLVFLSCLCKSPICTDGFTKWIFLSMRMFSSICFINSFFLFTKLSDPWTGEFEWSFYAVAPKDLFLIFLMLDKLTNIYLVAVLYPMLLVLPCWPIIVTNGPFLLSCLLLMTLPERVADLPKMRLRSLIVVWSYCLSTL